MEHDELLEAAELIEQLAESSTRGQWQRRGLLATRPEIVARRADGSTEHVAEARAGSVRWISTLSPAIAPALAGWLRSAACQDGQLDPNALSLARELLGR